MAFASGGYRTAESVEWVFQAVAKDYLLYNSFLQFQTFFFFFLVNESLKIRQIRNKAIKRVLMYMPNNK